jgi:hypothetical protein
MLRIETPPLLSAADLLASEQPRGLTRHFEHAPGGDYIFVTVNGQSCSSFSGFRYPPIKSTFL